MLARHDSLMQKISYPDLPKNFRIAFDFWNAERQQAGDAARTVSAASTEPRWVGPRWRSSYLAQLPPELLPWAAVVDVCDEGADFRYRYWGTERSRIFGGDFTSQSVISVRRRGVGDDLAAQYRDILEERMPLLFRNLHPTPAGSYLEFESMRLPFSADGNRVTEICSITRVVGRKEQLIPLAEGATLTG